MTPSPPRSQVQNIMTDAAKYLEIDISVLQFSPALTMALKIQRAVWQRIWAANVYSKPTEFLAKSPSMPKGIYVPGNYIAMAEQS